MFRTLTLLAMLVSSQVYAQSLIILNKDNTITFNQPVTEAFVAEKQAEIMIKNFRLTSSQPLYLVLDTPGGSVPAGLQFIDFVKALGRPVHTITIFAASMGYKIVQQLGTRYIIPSGTLMSHRGAVGGLSGQVPGELNSRLNHIQSILSGMSSRAAARVGMDKKAYDDAIVNELWVSGEEAVNSKHADKLAKRFGATGSRAHRTAAFRQLSFEQLFWRSC